MKMRRLFPIGITSVTARLAIAFFCMTSVGHAAEEAVLLQRLALADEATAAQIEQRLTQIWSRSGSASFDLLLQRGEDALEADDIPAAIEHFTALTDHAPEFAEGWHRRAQAYFLADLMGPAVADLECSLALNPNHFGALRGMAGIFERLNMPQMAFKAYAAFLTIHPSDSTVRSARDRLQQTLLGSRI
jgi:tetratricopeptide (TPR) repeat protein